MMNCAKCYQVYVEYNNDESRKGIWSMNIKPIL